MSATAPNFSCPACQRSFPWKPESAGRQGKCKCGHILTVPLEPESALEPAVPQKAPSAPLQPQQATCPGCTQPLEPKAVLCVNCGYDLRTGRQVNTEVADEPKAAPTRGPAKAKAPAASSQSMSRGYPTPRRFSQEEETGSTKMYLILGGALLLVAMGVGGWIIFKGTGGADANRPRLGDDARVEAMIANDYPKDLTEWIEAHSSRMLGGQNARQAAAMEENLKKRGATKVLAFGNGVLCLFVGIELPDDPAKRKAVFEWEHQHQLIGEPPIKDVGQRYILHKVGM